MVQKELNTSDTMMKTGVLWWRKWVQPSRAKTWKK